jgi:putative Holliday junction resolvase
MRIMGIDYGSKRVGIALGDTESRIASPWKVLPNEGALALLDAVNEIVKRDLVEAFVVGVPEPLRDTGLVNKQVKETQDFISGLKRLGLPVNEVSEVLSSRLAARQAAEAGDREKRDDLAAAAILQTWLDRE